MTESVTVVQDRANPERVHRVFTSKLEKFLRGANSNGKNLLPDGKVRYVVKGDVEIYIAPETIEPLQKKRQDVKSAVKVETITYTDDHIITFIGSAKTQMQLDSLVDKIGTERLAEEVKAKRDWINILIKEGEPKVVKLPEVKQKEVAKKISAKTKPKAK